MSDAPMRSNASLDAGLAEARERYARSNPQGLAIRAPRSAPRSTPRWIAASISGAMARWERVSAG
jgi:hypothetical protein